MDPENLRNLIEWGDPYPVGGACPSKCVGGLLYLYRYGIFGNGMFTYRRDATASNWRVPMNCILTTLVFCANVLVLTLPPRLEADEKGTMELGHGYTRKA